MSLRIASRTYWLGGGRRGSFLRGLLGGCWRVLVVVVGIGTGTVGGAVGAGGGGGIRSKERLALFCTPWLFFWVRCVLGGHEHDRDEWLGFFLGRKG